MSTSGISRSTLQRVPTYLTYLKTLPEGGSPYISATNIAAALGLGEVQVRKDLAAVTSGGKPKVGYVITDLIRELDQFLGYADADFLTAAAKLPSNGNHSFHRDASSLAENIIPQFHAIVK